MHSLLCLLHWKLYWMSRAMTSCLLTPKVGWFFTVPEGTIFLTHHQHSCRLSTPLVIPFYFFIFNIMFHSQVLWVSMVQPSSSVFLTRTRLSNNRVVYQVYSVRLSLCVSLFYSLVSVSLCHSLRHDNTQGCH